MPVQPKAKVLSPGGAPGALPEPKEWIPGPTKQTSASEASSMPSERMNRVIAQGPEKPKDSM